jgi:hypothetical protein
MSNSADDGNSQQYVLGSPKDTAQPWLNIQVGSQCSTVWQENPSHGAETPDDAGGRPASSLAFCLFDDAE